MKNPYRGSDLGTYVVFAIPSDPGNLDNRIAFSVNFLNKILYGIFFVLSFCKETSAQIGVANFTYQSYPASTGRTYTGSGGAIGAQTEYRPSSNNTFTYRFGTSSGLSPGTLSVNGYIAGGTAFTIIDNIITSVVMRRVNNTNVSGDRDILFFAGNRNPGLNTTGQTNTSFTVNLNAEYVADMGPAFSSNNLLVGTDNIFANQGNGNNNNNNIERVDVLVAGGFQVTDASKFGFPVFERGIYGAHDAFKIAVITGVDGSGTPTSYSSIISVTSANYNNTNGQNPIADGTYSYLLFRRDGTSNLEVNQHITDQGIGGVAFLFSDFGIANGTTVYGYSLVASDFGGSTGSHMINYSNSSRFPTNTPESGSGGLDPLAVMGISVDSKLLTVELTSFTASRNAGGAALKWTTVTEIANEGFYIQRSADGTNWTDISFVPSKAKNRNSASLLYYDFLDKEPLAGKNYYRLRQIDINNKETLSEIRTVSFENSSASAIRVFPNPVANHINIQGIQQGNNLILTNNKGSVITKITANASSISVPSDKLSPGIYFLKISHHNAMIKTVKIVKTGN